MQVLENTKREVEAKANTMSDFLRMEYLELVLKKFNDPEIMRYCYQELSKLYERRSMYTEAIKYLSKLKEICILQRERTDCLYKEAELFIRSGQYDRADMVFKEGIKDLNEKDRFEFKRKMVDLFTKEATTLEKVNKVSGALKIYERLINYLTDNEKNEVKKKMLIAYKKLGRVRESIELERQLGRDAPGFREELAPRNETLFDKRPQKYSWN
jgi:tetratricopeptide (TPR) repeat protein